MQTIFFIVVRSLPFPANAMTIKSPSSLSRLILPFFPSSFYVAPTAAFSSYYVAASTCSLSLSPSLSLSLSFSLSLPLTQSEMEVPRESRGKMCVPRRDEVFRFIRVATHN